MARLVVDPVTRVGGHLRVEVEVRGGEVTDAWSAGTMFRGLEQALVGRDPRDAWLLAQRICGTCTGVHALASVRAVENALGIAIPTNARLLRNLLAATQNVDDHVMAFYLRQAFDWIDVVAALDANPAEAAALARSKSPRTTTTAAGLAEVQGRLQRLVSAGQPGPFANGPWGHPAMTISPEASLVVAAHALEALDWQRTFMRLHTLLGGKSPHPQSFIVGGMTLEPPWGGPATALPGEHPGQVERESPTALGPQGLALMAELIDEGRRFVEDVLVPDVLMVAEQYRRWARIGAGPADFLAFGEFPEDDSTRPELLLPQGRIVDGGLGRVEPVDQVQVAETIAHAHYVSDHGDGPRHPADADARPSYQGPPPPVTSLEGATHYSWIKAPRYAGGLVQTGALARLLVGYVEARGAARAAVFDAVEALGGEPDVLVGTMGRIVARALEARLVVGRMEAWHDDLLDQFARGDLAIAETRRWSPDGWPSTASGFSLGESPRGAVGHWVTIRNGSVAEYQVVDASTWNASPRDAEDRRGAMEEALVGIPVADPERPLEVLRVVHSFDPCSACAVHLHGPDASAGPRVHVQRRRPR